MKRKYSGFSVREAMELIPAEQFTRWQLDVQVRQPSEYFVENMRRLDSFDLENSEMAKTVLIDDLFREIVPNYPNLKVWKGTPLETNRLTGMADYLITPKRAYVATPLLCVAEAKRDDFVQGRAQCLAEMVACQWNNRQEGHELDVYGIVSNGQTWQFYCLALTGEVFETEIYTTVFMPELLGALDYVCARCAANVP